MKKKIILKPWGSEEILSHNNRYVLKKLTMKKGKRCSLQYHRKKHETVYVISGKLKVTIGKSLKNEIIKFEKESKFNLRAFYLSQNGRIRENSLFRSKYTSTV